MDNGSKVHTVSFAGLAHADRDPPGSAGYERLFQTMRELGLAPAYDLCFSTNLATRSSSNIK